MSTKDQVPVADPTRREMLGKGAAAVAWLLLPGCSGSSAGTKTAIATGSDADTGSQTDTGSGADISSPALDAGTATPDTAADTDTATQAGTAAETDTATDTETETETETGKWKSGGTKGIAGPYPNPFTKPGPSCELTCEQALGPCFVQTKERKDISEGHAGLPLVLMLRVLDKQCQPLTNATVDIWHTDRHGVYSGKTPDSQCNNNDPKYQASQRMRGWQKTDNQGIVRFHTIYPSWYPGRAIHIHFTVRLGGAEMVTSQLYFDDAQSAEVFAGHVDYSHRPKMDTSNADEGMVGKGLAALQIQTQLQGDGVMLGWKTLIVRTSTSDSNCQG